MKTKNKKVPDKQKLMLEEVLKARKKLGLNNVELLMFSDTFFRTMKMSFLETIIKANKRTAKKAK